MSNIGRTIRLTPHSNTPGAPDCGVAPGDLIGGRFRLDAVVGHGGQAVVFQAADLQRALAPVAVKVARRDLAPADRREAAAVLQWEAGLLRRLRHPALPRLHQLAAAPASTWLARDLVPGRPLLGLARQGLQPEAQVRLWAALLCDLLTYLHTRAAPVVCGDLKPANLIVRPDGTLALVDMGAASTLTRRPPRKARPRHGTPGYAPPEQLGSWGYDERADLFGLAVTCYELLTGLDPAVAPLQLDLDRLDRTAPRLAPALRWALELDRERRCPSAAALRARLDTAAPAAPLSLQFGVSLRDSRDLNAVLLRHPALLEPALAGGELEAWLARQPDPSLGALRYRLRAARTAARHAPLETLLVAMAPAEGSPLIDVTPDRLRLGDVPLKSWRVWGRPAALTLHNTALSPLRWELECPQQPDAELRVLIGGKLLRAASGALAPGAKARLEIVASGAAGPRQGALTLRCGQHSRSIPWEANARAGVPVGARHVGRLEELDLGRADLVPALEVLLSQGALARWMRATGRRALAAELDAAMRQKPDELGRRLLVGRVLHEVAPAQFPLLRVHGLDLAAAQPLAAGQPAQLLIELENLGAHPAAFSWRSRCPWATLRPAAGAVPALGRQLFALQLSPPAELSGPQTIALELGAGALPLALSLTVQISAERWWQRLRRILGV
jgi:hypothetical protein